jgi:N-acetylglucosamine-6-phosphate deacetylase
MIIKNAKIVLKDKVINGYLEFDNNKIINICQGKTNKEGYDANGNYVLPAFFDSHTHGGYGYDFNMGTESRSLQLNHYLKEVVSEGVASIMMTTVTCSQKDLKSLADNYLANKKIDNNNVIKG